MKLSLTKPKNTREDIFYTKWIIFIVSFFRQLTKDELEQIVFNLWSEDATKLIDSLLESKKLSYQNNFLSVGMSALEKEIYQGVNFNSCPVMEDEKVLKDLWTVGDDLATQVKKSDVENLLQEFVNLADERQEFYFQVTSMAKNYKVKLNPYSQNSRYVRFFLPYGKNS